MVRYHQRVAELPLTTPTTDTNDHGPGHTGHRPGVQQQSAATAPDDIDLKRPAPAADLHERPASTSSQLVHTEEVSKLVAVGPVAGMPCATTRVHWVCVRRTRAAAPRNGKTLAADDGHDRSGHSRSLALAHVADLVGVRRARGAEAR